MAVAVALVVEGVLVGVSEVVLVAVVEGVLVGVSEVVLIWAVGVVEGVSAGGF